MISGIHVGSMSLVFGNHGSLGAGLGALGFQPVRIWKPYPIAFNPRP